MPVVIRFGRFRFMIYPQDHAPAHVHVVADEAEAKFDLWTGRCVASYGFSQHTVHVLENVVQKNRNFLFGAWNKYEGQE